MWPCLNATLNLDTFILHLPLMASNKRWCIIYGSTDWTGVTALDYWSGALDYWNGVLDYWSGTLDYWSEALDYWSGALDYWSGLLALDYWIFKIKNTNEYFFHFTYVLTFTREQSITLNF